MTRDVTSVAICYGWTTTRNVTSDLLAISMRLSVTTIWVHTRVITKHSICFGNFTLVRYYTCVPLTICILSTCRVFAWGRSTCLVVWFLGTTFSNYCCRFKRLQLVSSLLVHPRNRFQMFRILYRWNQCLTTWIYYPLGGLSDWTPYHQTSLLSHSSARSQSLPHTRSFHPNRIFSWTQTTRLRCPGCAYQYNVTNACNDP